MILCDIKNSYKLKLLQIIKILETKFPLYQLKDHTKKKKKKKKKEY